MKKPIGPAAISTWQFKNSQNLHMNADSMSGRRRPEWVQELERVFGAPNQAAFGTAVFFEVLSDHIAEPDHEALEQRALAWYQFFCGGAWKKFGPDHWLGTWRIVYTRSDDSASVIDELSNLEDRSARSSGSAMLDGHEDSQKAKQALKQAFDAPTIDELQIYGIGDGDAMSGILIAGRRADGESAFVTFLLD